MSGRNFVSRAALFAATSAIAMAGASSAWAQDAAAAEAVSLEEIVVTGFRSSLASALESKRNSNMIIESIAAEDMGKFPDQNIAESLQRLPGVQIDRQNGQGTKVRIRGLDQNRTVLNGEGFVTGLEVFTLGEGSEQFSDSLEGIPAELLGGVDVYKSPNASLVEGGMGGLVDLKTRSALSFDEGFSAAGNFRLSKGSNISGWEPVGAGVFAFNWNDRIGVVGTVSYDKQNIHVDALGGDNRGNWRFAENGSGQTFWAPEFRFLTDRDERRERLGGSVGVDAYLTDALKFKAEWFHSELNIDTEEVGVKFPFTAPSEGVLDATQPFDIDENGVLLSGTVNATSAEVISVGARNRIKSDNIQAGFEYDNDGPLKGSLRFAYSDGSLDKTQGHNDVRFTPYNVPTADPSSPTGFSHQPANPLAPSPFVFSIDNGNGRLPTLSLGAADTFTNPNNGFFKSHWVFANHSDQEAWSLRGDVDYTPEFVPARNVVISAGARYAERDMGFDRDLLLADYSGKGELNGLDFGQNWTPFGYFQDGAIGFKSCELPAGTPGIPGGCNNRFGNSPPLITPFQTFGDNSDRLKTIENFFASGGNAAGTTAITTQDPRQIVSNPVAWISALYPDTPFTFFNDPLSSFTVDEETTAGYVMADFGNAEDRFHINAGVRIIHTELKITQGAAPAEPNFWGTDSWNGVLRNPDTLVSERSYTDILPSANIVLDVTDQHKVRVSTARVVARQPLFNLGQGLQTFFTRVEDPLSPDFNKFEFVNGNGGNPDLDPFRATQADVAWEYYYGEQGLLSVAGFWKEVDTFITQVTEPVFVPDETVDGGTTGSITRPVNGEGGKIRGIELGFQQAFAYGFGVNANYTFSDSKSPTSNDFDSNLPIPGVSKHAYNAQVYYEDHGIEARLSWAWRSKNFVGNFGFGDGGQGTKTLGRWARSYGQLDSQFVYHVHENFDLTLEALNLTKEAQSEYLQFENLPFRYNSGVRRILIGGRFRY